jgi:Icc-related predicted phosphoesterase
MKITFFSDTHSKHRDIEFGERDGLLIFAGDLMTSGYDEKEVYDFCSWYNDIDGYSKKIFIAGNHDRFFEKNRNDIVNRIEEFDSIHYLLDETIEVKNGDNKIKIYGSPFTPFFYNWAFNLHRGKPLEEKWSLIPDDTDILITHGPSFGVLDTTIYNRQIHLGCEELSMRIEKIKPKIHLCGHIHSGRGIVEKNGVLYINASVLNESYEMDQKPIVIDYDFNTNNWDVIL